ncbi:queuosine precursor transporter [Neorickettsia sennetsu]|nr:queuosine precursor transporter [Neorickettsia sennetsu]
MRVNHQVCTALEQIFLDSIKYLEGLPSYTTSLMEFLLCMMTILISFKFFGEKGICAFSSCVFILANIQVLRQAQFFFQDTPVALGTISFSSIFLANNILTEYRGVKAAKTSVYLSFLLYAFFTLEMIITLSYSPKTDVHYSCMQRLFQSNATLLFSGIIAYLVSQLSDIYIFSGLKQILPNRRFLWLRNVIGTGLSSLIDNIIFSTLAWYVLTGKPVEMKSLVFTYILGTYWIRILVALLGTPFLYFAKRLA